MLKETLLSFPEMNCENPVVAHGTRISVLQDTYTVGSTVAFECVIGYFMVGSYLIRCNESNLWNPELPICRKSKNKNRFD